MIKTSPLAHLLTDKHKSRFRKKVYRRSDEECWEWTGARHPLGYGVFALPMHNGKWRMTRAHRVAYAIANGDPADGLVVCHSCDNPSCCNPWHLFAATQMENLRDMKQKGRKAVGSRNGLSKLTEEDIPKIRALIAQGVMVKDIAITFGMSKTAISNIKTNNKWRHVMIEEMQVTR